MNTELQGNIDNVIHHTVYVVGLWTVWKQFLVYILVFVNAEKTASTLKKKKEIKKRMWLPYDLWVGRLHYDVYFGKEKRKLETLGNQCYIHCCE